MHKYQEFARFFAQLAGGLETLGGDELDELGARNVSPGYRGVHFEADHAALYRINYAARLPTRIIAPLTSFGCHDPDYLYRTAREIEWPDFMGVDQTFAVYANVSNSRIRHSQYAALRVKDAIVDRFRDATGRRPSVSVHDPDVWFNLYIENDHATISIGTSPGSMHRRGYRVAAGPAPIQETVAAAIIRLAEWEGERPIVDPMCGSGTLLAESLMRYCRIPSGYLQTRFGFEALPDFDADLWKRVRSECDAEIRSLPDDLISGSDRDQDAVHAAHANLRKLPGGERVRIHQSDFRALKGLQDRTIVVNPPYGIRMKESSDVGLLLKEFGDFLKQRCDGSTAYVYVGSPALLKHVGLRASWKKPLVSGRLDGRLARYDVYRTSH